ncbi:DUF3159 domain-containing protein [Alloscardovia theropitheci]|uniref:DUF3159 domain-containing protein n=1 Tax=Alloscardovia theropitheci TaxID=2496842 RepID=A0A4R0QY45_9BIFI|nr:DUF3159 domain-containing protein [Alloscardovia theropitheci]TCD54650.1 DUF3159 domain-containing protein [Alloscardovia theropitheci]
MVQKQHNTGIKSLADSTEEFSVWDSIGGWRGIFEAVIPVLVFIVAYTISANLGVSLTLVGVIIVAIIVARLIQRQTLMGALSGIVVTAISVVFALLFNSARDFYTPGIFINIAAVIVLLVSIIILKPGIGWMLEQFTNDNAMHELFKPYMYATWVWIVGFSIRLIAEIPLYLTHNVGALGVTRIITGVPLFALMLLVSWLIIAPQRKKLLTNRDMSEK